jgi:chromosomal replication initiator protein
VAALEHALCQRIGEPRFTLWFENKAKFAWADDLLTVGVPNLFYQEWLQKKFLEDVRCTASTVLGQSMRVRFSIDPELFQATRRQQAGTVPETPLLERGENLERRSVKAECLATGAAPAPLSPVPPRLFSKSIRRWHRLEDFVVGSCNRVAHASALSMVEEPGQGGNPLVLHGPVGTGKTHLLEGIHAGLQQRRPDWRACFVTAEDFTNRFVQAMRSGKLAGFRKHFRECDLLLLDDLHFLASKPATQEEFLHTFNVLAADGRQVVVTCDCHPRLGEQFMPELTDRLLGGAIWGLMPPERDTRLDMLRFRAAKSHALVPEEVLAYLADQVRGNVRELQGALNTLLHYARVAGRPVDLSLAGEALSELLRHSVRAVELADVERAVAAVLRLESGALQSRERRWAHSHPRMLAMFLARKHTGSAYTEIGRRFGGRNHSTAVAAEKKVRQWLEEDGHLMVGQRKVRIKDVVELVERELLR